MNSFLRKHKRYLGLAWKTGGDFSSREALLEKGRRAWNMRRSRCCGAPVHTCAPPLGNTFKISVSCRTSGARSGIQPRHVATKCGSGRRIKCGVTEGSAAGCSRPCAGMTQWRDQRDAENRFFDEIHRSPGWTRGPFTPSILRSIRQSFPVQARNTDSSSTVIPGRAQRDPGIHWQRAIPKQPLLDPRPRLRSGKDDGRGIGHAGNPREIAGCSRPCASMTMMREAQAEQYRALGEFNRSPGSTRGPFTPSTVRSIRQWTLVGPVPAKAGIQGTQICRHREIAGCSRPCASMTIEELVSSEPPVVPGRAQRDPGIQWRRALQRQPLLDPRPRLRSGKDDSEHTEAQGLCVIHANQEDEVHSPIVTLGLDPRVCAIQPDARVGARA